MKIDSNTVVSLAYKIHADSLDGMMIEFAEEMNPRSIVFGFGKAIPGFELKLNGLEAGESFEFKLKPSEAFGTRKDDMVVNVPKTAFVVDGKLREDLLVISNEINMMDNQGNPITGTVREVRSEDIVMDFNHPLADKTLFVAGKVMAVRAVTPEDLNPSGGCGSGCGCSSEKEEASGCCSTEKEAHHHEYDEDCPSCGNPADQRGQGIGNCGCG